MIWSLSTTSDLDQILSICLCLELPPSLVRPLEGENLLADVAKSYIIDIYIIKYLIISLTLISVRSCMVLSFLCTSC